MEQNFNGQIDPSTGSITLTTGPLRTDDVRVLDNEVIARFLSEAKGSYNYALTSTQVKNIINNGAINFAPSTRSP